MANTVTLSSSAGTVDISGTTTLTATPKPAPHVISIRFYVDDVLKSTDTTAPWTYAWDTTTVSDGPHQVRVAASFSRNQIAEYKLNITVRNVFPEPPPPPTQGVPVNTAIPTISGTTTVGQTLTCSPGSWTNSPTSFTYQWLRCDADGANCVAIAGATSFNYVLVSADATKTIRCAVAAHNAVGTSAIAESDQTAAIAASAPAVPVNTAPPLISGTTTSGFTLSLSNGSWTNSPTSYTYQWRRCDSAGAGCVNIAGATANTYTLTASDVGSTIRGNVVAINAAGSSTAASSAQTTVIAPPPPSPGISYPASYYTGPLGANNVLPPKEGTFLGVWGPSNPGGAATWTEIKALIAGRESAMGRKYDFIMTTTQLPDERVEQRLEWINAHGSTPATHFGAGYSPASVNAGEHDTKIRSDADYYRSLGFRVMIRLYHEFDQAASYYSLGQPGALVAAWRRIVNLYKERGANNVGFWWCPGEGEGSRDPAYWPGDTYVDWAGSDGYNWVLHGEDKYATPYEPGWCEFEKIFHYPVGFANLTNGHDLWGPRKPYVVGESGCTYDEAFPTSKGQWYRNVVAAAKSMPYLRGISWFDVDASSETSGGSYPQRNNWLVDRGPAESLAGFVAMASDPWFNTRS